jgi:hypothetical protein
MGCTPVGAMLMSMPLLKGNGPRCREPLTTYKKTTGQNVFYKVICSDFEYLFVRDLESVADGGCA